MSTLSQAQLSFFNENGYLVLENLFSPAEVKALQKESDYIIELILNSSLMHQRISGRLDWSQT